MTLLLFFACGDEDERLDLEDLAAQAPPAEVVEAPVPLEPPLTENPAISSVGEAMNRFAFDLLARLENEFVFSPASLSTAWSLLDVAARGDTETAIATVFHLPDFESGGVAGAFGGWQREINAAEGPWTLRMANRIWAHEGLALKPEFTAVASEGYGADVGLVDFGESRAHETINAWVSENTEERIPELLQPGSVSGDTRIVLTNAITFLGTWASPFELQATTEQTFHAPTGDVQVPMMNQTGRFPYYEAEGIQVVELPYQGERLSALVVLSEKPLDWSSFSEWSNSTQSARVRLAMPRFALRWRSSLREPLSGMGLGLAFSSDADLSGLSDDADLLVSDCVHEAWIQVDEEGTQAAAATGIVVQPTSIPPPPVDMTVDRPFHFLVVDKPSGAILFLARVENPNN